jgi:hypothetical protein
MEVQGLIFCSHRNPTLSARKLVKLIYEIRKEHKFE